MKKKILSGLLAVAFVFGIGTSTVTAESNTEVIEVAEPMEPVEIDGVVYDYDRRHYIRELFLSFLYLSFDRAPDDEGNAFWLDVLEKGERTPAEIVRFFLLDCEEMENMGATNEDFVTDIYWGLLWRKPETGGFEFWVDELNNGLTKAELLEGFLWSPEFQNLSNQVIYGLKMKMPTLS